MNYAPMGWDMMLYAHTHTESMQMQHVLTHMQGCTTKSVISKPDMHCYRSFKGIVRVQPEEQCVVVKTETRNNVSGTEWNKKGTPTLTLTWALKFLTPPTSSSSRPLFSSSCVFLSFKPSFGSSHVTDYLSFMLEVLLKNPSFLLNVHRVAVEKDESELNKKHRMLVIENNVK